LFSSKNKTQIFQKIRRITSRKIANAMGKENTRHADFMPIYSGISGAPRATLFTSALRNRYAERGQDKCSNRRFKTYDFLTLQKIWGKWSLRKRKDRAFLPSFRVAVSRSESKEGGARRSRNAPVILRFFRVTGVFPHFHHGTEFFNS
jgi:hypothetical protein